MKVLLCASVLFGFAGCGKTRTVGNGIAKEDITEFWYTYATSTFPPQYQRYRFYTEDGKYLFYHETREGDVFPLTEEYITFCGTSELTQAQWDQFYSFLYGGTVKAREENLDSGDPGPWLYLYWKNDKGKYQEFTFESYSKEKDFESFCESLKQ